MALDAPRDFIVLGESLIDLLPAADNGTYIARPGGSPLNVAVGLARLGQPTALAARLSSDFFAAILRRYLSGSGVDLRHARTAPEPSTIAFAELSDGQARYEFSPGGPDFRWTPADLAFLPGGARCLHFGSLASWLPPGDAVIAAAVSRVRHEGKALVSYDPNIRPALQADAGAARRQVEQSVRQAHVVKASADDLHYLYGARDPGSVARLWLELGAALVVVTDGADGATAWTQSGLVVSRPAYPVTICDTIGAGDAFTSGLLDSLARRNFLGPASLVAGLDGSVLERVLDDAGFVAGLTCQQPGANPPWRSEIDTLPGRETG